MITLRLVIHNERAPFSSTTVVNAGLERHLLMMDAFYHPHTPISTTIHCALKYYETITSTLLLPFCSTLCIQKGGWTVFIIPLKLITGVMSHFYLTGIEHEELIVHFTWRNFLMRLLSIATLVKVIN